MRRLAPLALALCLLLAGCAPLSAGFRIVSGQDELPLPASEPVEAAVGDSVAPRAVPSTLYYPAEIGQELVAVAADVVVGPNETLPLCLLRALLAAPGADGVRRVAPEGTSVRGVRVSGATAVVDLSIDARSVGSARELFLMRAAIANTLCGAEGVIKAVDVLIGGQAESPFALPCGAGGAESAAARWARLESDEQDAQDGVFSVERAVVLYYPAREERFVVPQTRLLTFENGDFLSPVLAALADDAGLDPALRPALPDTGGPLVTGAEVITLGGGRRVARITFDGNLSALLERARVNAWQMYAALTCTLTGFLPGLDGVQICVGDGQLARVDSPDGDIAVEGGVLARGLFERTVGELVPIYMTAADGSLRRLGRAMAAEDAVSPRMVLEKLFADPRAWEEGVSRVIPDGLSGDDLLGVRIGDGVATLNFSAAFYAGCQRLTAQQERNLVFALVNTLTERGDVNAVRFQIEGETVPVLVHSISLLTPLARNPGLIQPQAGE